MRRRVHRDPATQGQGCGHGPHDMTPWARPGSCICQRKPRTRGAGSELRRPGRGRTQAGWRNSDCRQNPPWDRPGGRHRRLDLTPELRPGCTAEPIRCGWSLASTIRSSQVGSGWRRCHDHQHRFRPRYGESRDGHGSFGEDLTPEGAGGWGSADILVRDGGGEMSLVPIRCPNCSRFLAHVIPQALVMCPQCKVWVRPGRRAGYEQSSLLDDLMRRSEGS